jgi:transposase InsO family protein
MIVPVLDSERFQAIEVDQQFAADAIAFQFEPMVEIADCLFTDAKPDSGFFRGDCSPGRMFGQCVRTFLVLVHCSMSRRGDCGDNAPMESFFASLKKELIHHADYQGRAEARASMFEYIEVFYNHVRRHSALGYLSPVEYEQAA